MWWVNTPRSLGCLNSVPAAAQIISCFMKHLWTKAIRLVLAKVNNKIGGLFKFSSTLRVKLYFWITVVLGYYISSHIFCLLSKVCLLSALSIVYLFYLLHFSFWVYLPTSSFCMDIWLPFCCSLYALEAGAATVAMCDAAHVMSGICTAVISENCKPATSSHCLLFTKHSTSLSVPDDLPTW